MSNTENNHKKCPNGPVAGLQAQVPVVISRDSTQILVEATVPFPEKFPATEIVEVIKKVRNLQVFVCRDKALINGILDVNVVYKTFEGNVITPLVDKEPEVTFGDVKQIRFNVPFSGFVDVPGARPGDDFIVNFAGVEDECQQEILLDPISLECSVTAFRTLRLNTIVRVDLSIVRDILIPIRDLNQFADVVSPIGENNGNNCPNC
ncbi:MAG: DUF3794 domain-containing protein [Bacillota bacterium]